MSLSSESLQHRVETFSAAFRFASATIIMAAMLMEALTYILLSFVLLMYITAKTLTDAYLDNLP